MALPIKKKTAAAVAFMLGDLDNYVASSNFDLVEGDYVWKNIDVRLFTGYNPDKPTKDRLGVMITMALLSSPEEDKDIFYSFGGKANESFMPNADGKGIVPIPGGAATTLDPRTNWAALLKSLYDASMEPGVFMGDVSVLEGIHVHMHNIPEPAERASFKSNTAEVEDAPRKPGQIAIVGEILAKPWEGEGGIPEAPVAKAPAKGAAKPPVKAAGKPAPKQEQEEGISKEDLAEIASNGISTVLSIPKNANGMARLMLKGATFEAVKKSTKDEDVASAVIDTFFEDEDELNSVLGPLGYKLNGSKVVVAE